VNGNGCDTRNDVLQRDLTSKTMSGSCIVLRGRLVSPYNAAVINFVRGAGTSSLVQIDHVVALGDAWQKGAQSWAAAKREAMANDPLNLLAVDGKDNQQKSDADAGTWLPPNKRFRCAYVALQSAVKAKYGLWVTAAEKDAMVRVLSTCPTMQALRSTPMVLPKSAPNSSTSTASTPKPTPKPTAKAGGGSSLPIVHAGAFCSPEGARGVTSAGTAMVCRTSPTDTRDRWRRLL
jgi:hypothetical protein